MGLSGRVLRMAQGPAVLRQMHLSLMKGAAPSEAVRDEERQAVGRGCRLRTPKVKTR